MSEEDETLVPPLSVGEIIKDQEVISVGKKGEGTIKYEGYILFVEGTTEKDKGTLVDVKVDKILPKFGLGSLINNDDKTED